jgi:hypothetical protein
MLAFATREDDTGARRIPAEKHTTIVAGSVCLVPLRAFVRKAIPAMLPIRAFCGGILFYLGPGLVESHVPQYSISVWSIVP